MLRHFTTSCFLLLATASQGEVPLVIAETGHATVPVTITGLGDFQFVLDTGAEGSAIYAPFQQAHAIPLKAESIKLQGQAGVASLRLAGLASVSVDGLTATNIEAVVLDARADGKQLNGIVGLDVFGQSLLDFDLPRRRASFHPSGTLPAGLRAIDAVTATTTTGGLLTFPVKIGSVPALAVLDTGARATRINWKLGTLLGLNKTELAAGMVIKGATNGTVESSVATVSDVKFGQATLPTAPVLVADLPVFVAFNVADQPAIIFGMDWLEDVRLVVDFPLKKIWFAQVTPLNSRTADGRP